MGSEHGWCPYSLNQTILNGSQSRLRDPRPYAFNVLIPHLNGFQFFLHLHYYKSKLEGKNEFEGTVFDEYLELFTIMRDDFLSNLVDQVFMDIKARSMPYRKNK